MERLDRLLFAHRRPLAAVAAGLAVLLALSALRTAPAGVEVVVAAHDLASGTVLTEDDLTTVRLPADATPDSATTDPLQSLGLRIAGPMRAGEILTDARVLEPHDLAAYADGVEGTPVLSTIRIDDPGSLTSVRVGDRVDVVAIDPHGEGDPVVVAESAVVASLGAATDQNRQSASLGVVTSSDVALELAAAALRSALTVLSRAD